MIEPKYSMFTVYQIGEWNGKRDYYQYRYAIEARTADEALNLVTEDEDILTDDFVDAPNGIAWVRDGYAEEVGSA